MTLRSVFDVDVNADSFNEFVRTFEKWQTALNNIPNAWGAVNKGVTTTKSEFADLAASLFTMNELMATANKEADNFERHTSSAAGFLGTMSRHAHDLSTRIADATRSMLRWGGITSAAAGLLGFGGVYGLERMADWSGNLRRSSYGLGFAPGNAALQQSFQTNLGRIVDPGMFLGGVNTALHDASQRWTLYGAGLSEGQLHGKDTGQVSIELLQNISRDLKRTPENQLAQVMQAHGYDQFLSLQDAVRVRQTPTNELMDLIAQTKYDAAGNKVAITDETLKHWQDFDNALKTAGNTLWDTIVSDLVPLADPLKHLSQGMVEVVDAFLKAPWVKEGINSVADALDSFAKYVGTDDFKAQVEKFVDHVGELATATGKIVASFASVVKWVAANIPGANTDGDNTVPATLGGAVAGALLGGRIFGGVGAAVGGALGGAFGYKESAGGRPLSAGEREALKFYDAHPEYIKTPEQQKAVDELRRRSHLGSGSSSSSGAKAAGPTGTKAVADAYAAANVPPEAKAFMRDIGSAEATDPQQLAHHGPGSANAYGDDPSVGGHFPAWEGTANPPYGTSYGYGLFQDEHGTAKMIAQHFGPDFNFRDPKQQIEGNWWYASQGYAKRSGGRDLLTDLKNHTLDPSGRAWLGSQWARGGVAGTGTRYDKYLADTIAAPPAATDVPFDAAAYRAHLDDVAKLRAASGGGLFPPSVKFNSKGTPYELNMTAQERANQDEIYRKKNFFGDVSAATGTGTYSDSSTRGSSVAPSSNDTGGGLRTGGALKATPALPHVTVTVANQTGGNAGISASQTAQ